MTPKRPRDPNQLAKAIVDIATGEKPALKEQDQSDKPSKDSSNEK